MHMMLTLNAELRKIIERRCFIFRDTTCFSVILVFAELKSAFAYKRIASKPRHMHIVRCFHKSFITSNNIIICFPMVYETSRIFVIKKHIAKRQNFIFEIIVFMCIEMFWLKR